MTSTRNKIFIQKQHDVYFMNYLLIDVEMNCKCGEI